MLAVWDFDRKYVECLRSLFIWTNSFAGRHGVYTDSGLYGGHRGTCLGIPGTWGDTVHVVLDISRFLACGRRKAPSGIDRVEAAYARRWLDAPASAVTFVARGPRNGYAAVPRSMVADLADRLDAAWAGGPDAAGALGSARRIGMLAMARMMVGRGRARVAEVLARERRTLFLLVSHRLMEQPEPIAEMRRAGASFIPLVHDLIPATHPEYARPGVAMQHLQRLETVAALADGIIVNSAATAGVLRPHLVRQAAPPPLLVAPLGIGRPVPAPIAAEPHPYFVVIGTIEPRKNHLLLLHLWREFAARWGSAAPRLVLVGRRGWENENVLDLLERCTLLRGLVREAGSLPDREVAACSRAAARCCSPPSPRAMACRWPRRSPPALPPSARTSPRCARWAARCRNTSTRSTAPPGGAWCWTTPRRTAVRAPPSSPVCGTGRPPPGTIISPVWTG